MEDPTRDPASSFSAGVRRSSGGFRGDEPQLGSRLKRAMRRARVDEAERAEVIATLRGAEMARLEMLRDALEPLLAEAPPEIDLFDVAIMPGEHPRLFIDMIGFVDIAPDRRAYRFVQDTRHGRIALAESESIDAMIDAIADYMAHRLLEREKALAAEVRFDHGAGARRAAWRARLADERRVGAAAAGQSAAAAGEAAFSRAVLAILSFLIEVLGAAAFFMLLAIGGWGAWKAFVAWGAAS
ncbi:hypothetical protein [Methylocapsa aurea]|uniref:hypothetical protein n=1 Tax=Methylocapsa aurea TaxID=663610 RepID=UPI00068CD4AB